jgi:hypothetical protein
MLSPEQHARQDSEHASELSKYVNSLKQMVELGRVSTREIAINDELVNIITINCMRDSDELCCPYGVSVAPIYHLVAAREYSINLRDSHEIFSNINISNNFGIQYNIIIELLADVEQVGSLFRAKYAIPQICDILESVSPLFNGYTNVNSVGFKCGDDDVELTADGRIFPQQFTFDRKINVCGLAKFRKNYLIIEAEYIPPEPLRCILGAIYLDTVIREKIADKLYI